MGTVNVNGVDEATYDNGETDIPRNVALEQVFWQDDGEWSETASLGTEFNQYVLTFERELPESSRVEHVEVREINDEAVGITIYMTGLEHRLPADTRDDYTRWVLEDDSDYEEYQIGLVPA